MRCTTGGRASLGGGGPDFFTPSRLLAKALLERCWTAGKPVWVDTNALDGALVVDFLSTMSPISDVPLEGMAERMLALDKSARGPSAKAVVEAKVSIHWLRNFTPLESHLVTWRATK